MIRKSKFVKHFLRSMGFLYLSLIFVLVSCKSSDRAADQKQITSIEEYRKLRSEKLSQSRLIHNNDGGDRNFPTKFRNFVPGTEHIIVRRRVPGELGLFDHPQEVDYEFSVKNFLDVRSAHLIGSDVTTISYCTGSGFVGFAHNTKVGAVRKGESRPDRWFAIHEFSKIGTDVLEVTCNFAHENSLEFFWSHRMNDTHDAAHRTERPDERWSNFKEENPHFLMGTVEERVPARWSSVDFKHQEIRDLTVEFFTEVCKNYDVDGIEIDFFRHLFLFGNVARYEGVATREQLDMITDMVTRIREMTERVGMEKGKPILVLTRVPDSFEYCEGVGIALKEWIERGLIDIVIGTCYFRLNPWAHMVNALQNYDVKFYAGLSESRIRFEQHPALFRRQNAVYRARAAAAWQAGVDGIYLFNEFHQRAGYLSEIGEADKLTTTNNLYFVNYRGTPGRSLSNPNFYLKDGVQYLNLPLINPADPVLLGSEPLDFLVEIGNESNTADVFVVLYTESVKADDLEVSVNNTSGIYRNSTGDGLIIFMIPHSTINPGKNKLEIRGKGRISTDRKLLDAAILFYRDPDDPELRQLADLCF